MKVGVKFKSLKDLDKGAAALRKRLEESGQKFVSVGIHGVDAERKETSGVTNAEIGTFHEFGLGNNPERSFIRSTVDEKENDIHTLQKRIAAGVVTGKLSEERGLELLGMKLQSEIVAKIRSNIAPALSEATIEAKGSSTALIDSGQLVQAITYKVSKDKPE